MSIVQNARALLDLFRRSDWAELHIRVRSEEVFMARNDGGPNPMREQVPSVRSSQHVCAPHVATLLATAPTGTWVRPGDRVATLSLLDEQFEISATAVGEIGAALAEPGALLDYGQPVVELIEG